MPRDSSGWMSALAAVSAALSAPVMFDEMPIRRFVMPAKTGRKRKADPIKKAARKRQKKARAITRRALLRAKGATDAE